MTQSTGEHISAPILRQGTTQDGTSARTRSRWRYLLSPRPLYRSAICGHDTSDDRPCYEMIFHMCEVRIPDSVACPNSHPQSGICPTFGIDTTYTRRLFQHSEEPDKTFSLELGWLAGYVPRLPTQTTSGRMLIASHPCALDSQIHDPFPKCPYGATPCSIVMLNPYSLMSAFAIRLSTMVRKASSSRSVSSCVRMLSRNVSKLGICLSPVALDWRNP